MSTAITSGIKISVETFYQPEHSSVNYSRYVFAYRITIENDGDYPVQLIKRHWDITDAYGQKRVVDGEGVVGEQPMIGPGESYQYVSGCDFNTELGRMKGFYTMEKQGGSFFAEIPQFDMVVPFKLN